MASSVNIVKADAVFRLSTFLRRWKRAWLVLYSNGELRYFESKDSFVAKAVINIPLGCHRILSSHFSVDPPKHLNKNCIFGLDTYEGRWHFCADSSDDALSWRLALDEIKQALPVTRQFLRSTVPLGYTDGINYYRSGHPAETTVPLYEVNSPRVEGVYRGTDGAYVFPRQVIEHPDGSRTIILDEGHPIHCYCRRDYYCGCGSSFANGALLGLAASSLMWTPFLWSPFCW